MSEISGEEGEEGDEVRGPEKVPSVYRTQVPRCGFKVVKANEATRGVEDVRARRRVLLE